MFHEEGFLAHPTRSIVLFRKVAFVAVYAFPNKAICVKFSLDGWQLSIVCPYCEVV